MSSQKIGFTTIDEPNTDFKKRCLVTSFIKPFMLKKLSLPRTYYIKVEPNKVYCTSLMETLLIDFDKRISKLKAVGVHYGG